MCNLRFDDTNPDTEDTSFVDGIIEDLAWLGYPLDRDPLFTSDYFAQLAEWAELDLKPATRAAVMGGNAARLFGIDLGS